MNARTANLCRRYSAWAVHNSGKAFRDEDALEKKIEKVYAGVKRNWNATPVAERQALRRQMECKCIPIEA